MIRISQILKDKTKPLPVESKPEGGKQTLIQPENMQIARAVKETLPDIEKSKDIYLRAVQSAKDILKDVHDAKAVEISALKVLLEEMINYFVLGDRTLLNSFYKMYKPGEYLYSHMVNVTILSVALGLKLGYNKSRLNELAIAAYLHDVGMAKMQELALQPRSLSQEEYRQIKEHPAGSAKIVSGINDISQSIISAVIQHHEQVNGAGYPMGLKNKEISEYARIITVADIYEALTHSRMYRKNPSFEAIKEMLSLADSFCDGRILKLLINLIGVYPIGSYIELNTDKIAKVIMPNDDYPLRPVVYIFFDMAAKKLEQPYLLNLTTEPNLYIKRRLSDTEAADILKKQNIVSPIF